MRWKLLPVRLAGVAVLLVLLAGAGWWFFIRETNEAQKQAAPVTDAVREAASQTATPAASATAQAIAPGAAAAAAPSTLNGRSFRIIAGQSQAWYLAPERLASLPTTSTAKGTTTSVSGEFHLAAGGLAEGKTTTFWVGLKGLRSDESRRDDRVQGALQTSRFPDAVFTATKLEGMPAAFGPNDSVMQLTGMLELRGVTRAVVWELKVKQDGEILSGLATVKFRYDEFGITKPDIAGFVTVADEVTLQVQLFAAPA
ncbi:MAG: YceI family protein [Tepidiformaceae bacterium]